MGGEFPFNERWQLVVDKYKNVGEIMGDDAWQTMPRIVDPLLRYKRDPFHLQWLQLMAEVSPLTVQAYLAPRPFAFETTEDVIEDSLEEDD
jgi:hypothetical protein